FGGTTFGSFSGGTNGFTPLVITFNAGTSAAAIQALDQNITYFNGNDDPSVLARTVRFVVNDGSAQFAASLPATKSITVTAVNDPPVNTLPASPATNEDTALPISGISVFDVDAQAGSLLVTL